MNLAEQLKADINFGKIVTKLQRELVNSDRVFIDDSLAENNIARLKSEGFDVNTDGRQYNGGVYVSFKNKNQWR